MSKLPPPVHYHTPSRTSSSATSATINPANATTIPITTNATPPRHHATPRTNRYFGESNKLVAGVFSLAQKLAPSIVFIDELDSFLRQRGGDESALLNMKAEFMTHWDGLLTDPASPVMVLGATNRPYDIDQVRKSGG